SGAAAGDVDRLAGDEIGVLRRQEADYPGLVDRLGDAAQRGLVDLGGLGLLAAALPMRADALGQRDARRDRVDVDAVGAELVAELFGEGDDPALCRGIGGARRDAAAAPGDRGQVDDLAAALLLHHRHDGVGEQERAVKVELDEFLPVLETQLVHRRARFGDDRAAADRVDEDVDAAVLGGDRVDEVADLLGVECVANPAVGAAAGGADFLHRLFEPRLVVVDADDDGAFAAHDVGGRAADPARYRSDQGDPIG